MVESLAVQWAVLKAVKRVECLVVLWAERLVALRAFLLVGCWVAEKVYWMVVWKAVH
jgi:hypothetical protein